MKDTLMTHLARYPAMTAQDAVKLIFQSEMGVGHLLRDKAAALRFLRRELDTMPPRENIPLYEEIGPKYVRLDLREAARLGLLPEWIVGMMLASASGAPTCTRQEAAQTALRLVTDCGRFEQTEVWNAVRPLMESDTYLPSHSSAYRAAYAPAYRVIDAGFVPLLPVLAALAAKRDKPRLLLTIDGPCGSGKSTLAGTLSALLDAPVIRMDDFYVPHAQKTAERLRQPGGNADVERLMAECLLPWQRDGHVSYRPYSCLHDCLTDAVAIPAAPVTILEGSYCNLPPVKAMADVRVYPTISPEEQRRRLIARDGEAHFPDFLRRWIPLEQAYHRAYGLPDDGCIVLDGSTLAK